MASFLYSPPAPRLARVAEDTEIIYFIVFR
jgi:hypothetical protein